MLQMLKEIIELFNGFYNATPVGKLLLVLSLWITFTKGVQLALLCGRYWLITGTRTFYFFKRFKQKKKDEGLGFVQYIKDEFKTFINKEMGTN